MPGFRASWPCSEFFGGMDVDFGTDVRAEIGNDHGWGSGRWRWGGAGGAAGTDAASETDAAPGGLADWRSAVPSRLPLDGTAGARPGLESANSRSAGLR